ncbi:MAG: glycoside hydrolase 5 family protein [Syntrophomonadaceae bacterium]
MDKTFFVGINYWPAKKAMYWWKKFDIEEVREDFARLKQAGIKVVRIFLTWEDFQPRPDLISRRAIDNLCAVADLAKTFSLSLMPTFFCGHMSGVNWMPGWMLTGQNSAGRFPVFSDSRICGAQIRNFYTEKDIIEAQGYQVQEVCSALKDHEAITAYDLGNEASNCVIPPSAEYAHRWLGSMTYLINRYSGKVPVTLGMHAEDLEENRHLGPQDAALFCDFLSMHGYPFYLSWSTDTYDVDVLPFLGLVTAWLGKKPVLFQEFGAPTAPRLTPWPDLSGSKCPLGAEDVVAQFYRRAISRLYEENMIGCMIWCYADYIPELWNYPPLDKNLHERHFGIFRYDRTPKPVVEVLGGNLGHNRPPVNLSLKAFSWLEGEDRTSFYDNPRNNLIRLYKKYKQALKQRSN